MLTTNKNSKTHVKSSAKIRLFVLPKYMPQKTLKGIADNKPLKAAPVLTINQAGVLKINIHKKITNAFWVFILFETVLIRKKIRAKTAIVITEKLIKKLPFKYVGMPGT